VVGKRLPQLISNLKRCQIERAIALRLEVETLAAMIPKTAQVVLVDAPCSGQSLLAKGEKSPGCFHPATINGNANRQKRILANSAQLVAPQGYLVYTTCTYSPEENEQVIEWLIKRFPQFQSVEVASLADFQSALSHFYCYRMFPQTGLGAGAFTALLRNTEAGAANRLSEEFLSYPGKIAL
jgi:16S rRNA C967 or C1407 C5-methylase (RsmB/RsmF family)